jgi:pseudouridine-5'-phosphate glycosidase
VTPFLLARIKELTGGRSLATNIALVKHNALVGAAAGRRAAQRPLIHKSRTPCRST